MWLNNFNETKKKNETEASQPKVEGFLSKNQSRQNFQLKPPIVWGNRVLV